MPMIVGEMQIFISSRGPLREMLASCLERFLCQFECTLSGNRPGSTPCALRMESSGSKARRGAAWMWPKEGWPAQHGARERREVSFVEITTGVHRRGAGGTWGAKKYLQIGHGCNYIDVHPKWHPRGRWLNFESAAAGAGCWMPGAGSSPFRPAVRVDKLWPV
jgi:hypothetical protein